MAEQRMNFYRSLYDLASILPSEKGRRRLLVAMLDYFFEGIEPSDLNTSESKAFEAVRGRIEASKRNANNRRVSVANETANETREVVANETRNETEEVVANETDNENTVFDGDRQSLPLYSPSYSPSLGERTGVLGCTPPSLEEVRAYFEANGLRGDPESFFATYDSQGWVKGNGMPVHSWHSLALKWSQEERRRELDKPPEQQAKPAPKPVNLPDNTLEEDVAEFERRYGVKLRG